MRKFVFAEGELRVSCDVQDEDQVFHGGLLGEIWDSQGLEAEDRNWNLIEAGELKAAFSGLSIHFDTERDERSPVRQRTLEALTEWASAHDVRLEES